MKTLDQLQNNSLLPSIGDMSNSANALSGLINPKKKKPMMPQQSPAGIDLRSMSPDQLKILIENLSIQ
jgi:hypothetical protein